jgi:hypothetical protein
MKRVLNPTMCIALLFAIQSISYSQTKNQLNNGETKQILSAWSGKPKEVANDMIKKYGNPNEATASILI